MAKLWAGRTDAALNQAADDFNASIRFDSRMYRQDIAGSLAHAEMLGKTGILPAGDVAAIQNGLRGILADLESGALAVDPSSEDIHMFVEAELTRRIGEAGKRLHTARSRNDQVATDLRLYLRERTETILEKTRALAEALLEQAAQHAETILLGYTHLQRAQPVTFGQHLLAYCSMLLRDMGRMRDAAKRMNQSPLGACALAGTTYPIDRQMTAALLGFDAPCANSLDAVSDRDFCAELCAAWSILMMHLSRLSEEILLWSSWEFHFITLDDAFTTGSSIMPQKKNSDMAELARGKTGRVYGDLMGTLTMLKGLPLAYDKDMQEDKEAAFDAADTVEACLTVLAPMVATWTAHPAAMRRAAENGFMGATDCADYLTRQGVPFRTAYKITGQIVRECIERGVTLETLPLEAYQSFSPLFGEDIYAAISLDACVARRTSEGGTAPDSVRRQIKAMKELLENA
ncbi:MAG: argininosuccinate lyase [Clostridiales bacterium]|nr:argininosuccinate lyase [Clostridiales bacterium]MDY2834260.1 argininosuccinate lyase [Candidatus Aphodomonas sp.]